MATHHFVLALFVAVVSGMTVKDGYDSDLKQHYNDMRSAFNDIKQGVSSDPRRLWPGGRVPYQVDPFAEELMDDIRKAFDEIENSTCITFVPKSPLDDPSLVIIATNNRRSCGSSWGMVPGNSMLYIGEECLSQGFILMHTLHALGFVEEHVRIDRDRHINVHYENVYPGFEMYFQVLPPQVVELLTPYDFDSVMHIGDDAYAAGPGLKTISAKDGRQITDPKEKTGLSSLDIEKINKAYQCQT